MEEGRSAGGPGGESSGGPARPTEAQRRYLERGLAEAGGKLPLFDRDGRQVPRKTVQACIAHGWAAPWTANPIKPDWVVCKLTPAGYRVLGVVPEAGKRARE
ncbi:MAG TPA: hypothetical protein VGX95_05965 [Xanthobacteraceae bacterium]|jgi:hypothetical protein|nr:hypothetical protein [Xanthobacteraceae bacterium]